MVARPAQLAKAVDVKSLVASGTPILDLTNWTHLTSLPADIGRATALEVMTLAGGSQLPTVRARRECLRLQTSLQTETHSFVKESTDKCAANRHGL